MAETSSSWFDSFFNVFNQGMNGWERYKEVESNQGSTTATGADQGYIDTAIQGGTATTVDPATSLTNGTIAISKNNLFVAGGVIGLMAILVLVMKK